jgi:glucosyl-3-phosphoglycerate synthase
MRRDVHRWFRRRTWHSYPEPADLLERRSGVTVSVVLPALNEAATLGPIVSAVRRDLMETVPLVDELLVVDSGSSDGTAGVAAAAGARVVHVDDVFPEWEALPGKGEALWKGLAASSGDLVVFLDADLAEFDAGWVCGLLTPLLMEPEVQLVKAAYDRTLRRPNGTLAPTGGGRVTELVARPLLSTHWPQLTGLAQPLAGEYAGRRSLLERLPFITGYGVELGMLVDTLELAGMDAIAQVDLGRRVHRNRDDEALGRTAAALQLTALARSGATHADTAHSHADESLDLVQFSRDAGGALEPRSTSMTLSERPPLITVPSYALGRAQAS